MLDIVAIRIEPERARGAALAAIASAYADPSVRNQPIVAAQRLEAESIPAQFYVSSAWNVIPADVLKAAGVTPGPQNKTAALVQRLRKRTEENDG